MFSLAAVRFNRQIKVNAGRTMIHPPVRSGTENKWIGRFFDYCGDSSLPRFRFVIALLILTGLSAVHWPASAQSTSEDAAGALATRLEALLAEMSAAAPLLAEGTPFVVHFDADVGDLAVGAPVTVKGIRIGTVRQVNVVIDSQEAAINVPIVIDIVPDRLQVDGATATGDDEVYAMAERLVAKGLRATLMSATPLGGSQHVALAFVPDAPAASLDRSGRHPEIPAAPTFGERLQADAGALIEQLSALPVDEAVDEARLTFNELRAVLGGPEMRQALEALGAAGGQLQSMMTGPEMQEAMRQAAEAAGQFGNFVARLDTELEPSLAAMQRAVASIELATGDVASSIKELEGTIGPDSPLWDELLQTSRELANSTRALRQLVEYLKRHPDALSRGQPETQP